MARRIVTAREQAEMLAPWRPGLKRVSFHQLLAAPVRPELVNHLQGQFNDWAAQNPDKVSSYAADYGYVGDDERGPVGHWPTVENFLKEHYPAAHRGLSMGQERAAPLLDRPWSPIHVGPYEDPIKPEPYETGPEAKAKHGYDPAEVAAGMLLLHNESHPFRSDMMGEDVERLNEIAQSRSRMQRQYEMRQQRQPPPKPKVNVPADIVASLHVGMAYTAPWHPHIYEAPDNYGDDHDGQGRYWVRLPDPTEQTGKRVVGELEYEYYGPEVTIHSLSVNPKLQGKGMGQALVERLHADHPQRQINPGFTTAEGTGITNRLMDILPGARGKVSEDWIHSPLSEAEEKKYLDQQKKQWDYRSEDFHHVQEPDYTRTANREDYGGHHEPPGPDSGIPLHHLTGDYEIGGLPQDWMTHPQYYTHREVSPREERATQQMYQRTQGDPEAMVDIYRALPHGHDHFHTGDWVTPSLEYARTHGAGEGDPFATDPTKNWPVIKSTVPAKHLWHNGDSYFEMGYHGPSHPGTVV